MEEIVVELNKIRSKFWRQRWIGMALIVLGIAFIFLGLKWYVWLITILTGIGTWAISNDVKKEYVLMYKHKLIQAILETHFEDVYFDVNSGITKEEIDKARLRYYGTKFYTDHRLKATYKGVAFTYAPIRFIEEKVNKKGETSEKELFDGKWLSVKMHKKFKGEIQIHKNPAIKYKSYLTKVEFEDIAFNKNFKTFASTPHEAFFLITPKVMENITRLEKESYNTITHFDLSFRNTQLYTLINDFTHYYGVSILTKIKLEKVEQKIAEGVAGVKKCIDLLEIDTWGV